MNQLASIHKLNSLAIPKLFHCSVIDGEEYPLLPVIAHSQDDAESEYRNILLHKYPEACDLAVVAELKNSLLSTAHLKQLLK